MSEKSRLLGIWMLGALAAIAVAWLAGEWRGWLVALVVFLAFHVVLLAGFWAYIQVRKASV